jgi:preprotein translocase subunit SecY
MMSGDAFSQATFFALSVSPYITASIVIQLLSIAIPALEKMSKDQDGQKKLSAATRWVTVGLAIVTAFGYVNLLNTYGLLTKSATPNANNTHVLPWIVMIACLCAGASLIMWLAEKINEHGIGNGISIILFANIISGFTGYVNGAISMLKDDYGRMLTGWDLVFGIVGVLLSVALALGAIVLIVWFTNSERRIKVIYAKRVVGRKTYGGQKTNLPLKMNMAGVMPVIFASSIVSIPAMIAGFLPSTSGFAKFVNNWLGTDKAIYFVIFVGLIVAFSYFYIAISFNPVEVANNIRNNGGAIIGIRPQEMAPFIKKILNRVTLMGAIFLVVISGVPLIAGAIAGMLSIRFTSLAFAGTSLLIAVGVALELVRDLEAQLSMRNYKGFLD